MDLKKYPITFTTDWAENFRVNPEFYGKYSDEEERSLCDKYRGKSISLLELENLISEFGSVIFDGKEIEIYNMLEIPIKKIKLFDILDSIINLREKEIELLKEFKSVNKNT